MDELIDRYLKAQAELYAVERALIAAVKEQHLPTVMVPTRGVVVRLCEPDGDAYIVVEDAGLFIPPTSDVEYV